MKPQTHLVSNASGTILATVADAEIDRLEWQAAKRLREGLLGLV
jgi:hypothetical protein